MKKQKPREIDLPHTVKITEADNGRLVYEGQRGIRRINLVSPSEPSLPRSMRTANELTVAAQAFLTERGELVANEGPVESEEWWSRILLKYKFESKEAAAAEFLHVAFKLFRAEIQLGQGNQDSDFLAHFFNLILRYADAWHWWHMEAFEEHVAAYQGMRAHSNQIVASAVNAERDRQRRLYIREWLESQWREQPDRHGKVQPFATLKWASLSEELKRRSFKGFNNSEAARAALRRAAAEIGQSGGLS